MLHIYRGRKGRNKGKKKTRFDGLSGVYVVILFGKLRSICVYVSLHLTLCFDPTQLNLG